MCYAFPGPRCSGHARTDLAEATTRANQAFDDLHRAQSASTALLPWSHPARKNQSHAWQALQKAADAYDATPDGIQELTEQIAALQQDVTDHGDRTSSAKTITALQDRLRVGVATRQRQMAAYRRSRSLPDPTPTNPAAGTGSDTATSGTEQAPACRCIDFKYQNTCEHVTAADPSAPAHASTPDEHRREYEKRYLSDTLPPEPWDPDVDPNYHRRTAPTQAPGMLDRLRSLLGR